MDDPHWWHKPEWASMIVQCMLSREWQVTIHSCPWSTRVHSSKSGRFLKHKVRKCEKQGQWSVCRLEKSTSWQDLMWRMLRPAVSIGHDMESAVWELVVSVDSARIFILLGRCFQMFSRKGRTGQNPWTSSYSCLFLFHFLLLSCILPLHFLQLSCTLLWLSCTAPSPHFILPSFPSELSYSINQRSMVNSRLAMQHIATHALQRRYSYNLVYLK